MVARGSIERVKGTQDLSGAELARSREIARTLDAYLDRCGYEALEVPVLEHLELYLKKAGSGVVNRLYSFTDQGGRRLALRHEFTASVIRAYVERGEALPQPVRWRYGGPVFRYERPQRGRYRQHTQQGVELIGAPAPRGDAEIVSAACRSLAAIGLEQYELLIGHVGVALQLLDGLKLTDRTKSILLSSMEDLGRAHRGLSYVQARLAELGISRNGHDDRVREVVEGLSDEQARTLIHGLLTGMNVDLAGSRSPDEIVDRLLRKLRRPDESRVVNEALEFIARLSQLAGDPATVFGAARGLLREYGLSADPLDELAQIVDAVAASGAVGGRLQVDLGLARGLAYYTGMVFEIYSGAGDDRLQLCGGGRYDGLVRALGGRRDVPALGFAFGLERLAEALAGQGAEPPGIDVLVIASEGPAFGAALQVADGLRRDGKRVEVDVRGRTLKANTADAERRGIASIVLVEPGADGPAVTREIVVARR